MNVHECVSQQAGAHRASQRHCFLFINIYRCSRDLCNWICVMTSSCKCSQMWFMYGEFTELFSRRAEAVTIPNPKRKSCFHRGCLTPVYVSPRGGVLRSQVDLQAEGKSHQLSVTLPQQSWLSLQELMGSVKTFDVWPRRRSLSDPSC